MIACSCIHWLGSVFVSETNWGYSLLRAWQACSCGWHVMLAEYQGLCRIKSRSHLTGLWLLIGRGLDLAKKKKRNHCHSLGSCSQFKNNSNCHFVRWGLQREEKSLHMHHGVSCCVLPCSAHSTRGTQSWSSDVPSGAVSSCLLPPLSLTSSSTTQAPFLFKS